MNLRKITENVAADLDQIYIVNKGIFTHYYARLVCYKPFLVKGKIIERGAKGGFIRVGRVNLLSKKLFKIKGRMYEKSWAQGEHSPFVLTGRTFIENGASVGEGSYLGSGTIVGENSSVGDDCLVFMGSTIGKNSHIGNHSTLDFSQVGNNVYIGENAHIDTASVGITPDKYERLWWNNRGMISPHDFSQIKYNKIKVFARALKAAYYDHKKTILGENITLKPGSKIECGSVLGDDAKVNQTCIVRKNSAVPNGFIVQEKNY